MLCDTDDLWMHCCKVATFLLTKTLENIKCDKAYPPPTSGDKSTSPQRV